jgi:U5 small nuclear ribonucleoprotein component
MGNNALIRNVCIAGHLHHGKTLLLDMLVQETHLRKPTWNL